MGRFSRFKADYLITGALDGSNYYAAIGTTSKQIRARNMAETITLMTKTSDLERRRIAQARMREREIRNLEKELVLSDHAKKWLNKFENLEHEHGWDEDLAMKYMIGEVLAGQLGQGIKRQLLVNTWMPNILNKYCVNPLEGSLTSIAAFNSCQSGTSTVIADSKHKQQMTKTSKHRLKPNKGNRKMSNEIFNKTIGSYEKLPPLKTLQSNLRQRQPRSYKQLKTEHSHTKGLSSVGSVEEIHLAPI